MKIHSSSSSSSSSSSLPQQQQQQVKPKTNKNNNNNNKKVKMYYCCSSSSLLCMGLLLLLFIPRISFAQQQQQQQQTLLRNNQQRPQQQYSLGSFDIAQATESPNHLRLAEPAHIPQSPIITASKHNETSSTTTSSTTSSSSSTAPTNQVDATLPHSLAGRGCMEELRQLLQDHPELAHARDSPNQWTPLHEAARGGHITTAALLLEYGADINARHRHGGTPLYEAQIYQGRDSSIVQYLISNGAIIQEGKAQLRRNRGTIGTTTTASTQSERNHPTIEQQQQEQEEPNVDFDNDNNDNDIDDDFDDHPYLKHTTAHTLAGGGRISELNHLMDVQGSQEILSRQDHNGWTVLHEAARMNQVPMARFLIMHGADLHIRNKEGLTPLELAENRLGTNSAIYQYLLSEEEAHFGSTTSTSSTSTRMLR